jgi:ribosomal protein S18 acetylase RimI-like enzyme
MEIDTPSMDETDTLTDLWVALARDQYDHGSYLAAEDNQSPIHESICQHIVTGNILVARVSNGDSENDSDESSDHAHSDTDIAGFIMFTTHTGRYQETVSTGIIENLYVVPEQRGEEIGSALLDAAEDALKSDGTAVITLDVMVANEAARRFYARHGYDGHRMTMAKRETDTHSKGEQ